MARTNNLKNFLTDVANAIKTKKGSTEPINAKDFDTEIINLPSGGEKIETTEKDVNFYDYDGTVLYSYTKDEFLALTNMPDLPSIGAMTYDEWNYDLEKAQDYVNDYGKLQIGAICHTTDGKMRIYYNVLHNRYNVELKLFVKGTITIDWGDGSSVSSLSGTTDTGMTKSVTHTYNKTGKYIIEISFDDNTTIGWAGNGTSSYLLGNKNGCAGVIKLELPDKIVLPSTYAFNYMVNLVSVNIPKSVTTISDYTFHYNYALTCINLPSTITSFSSVNIFNYCYSTRIVTLGSSNKISKFITSNMYALYMFTPPVGITSFNINGSRSLIYAVFPKTVTELPSSAYSNTTNLVVYDFRKHTIIPTNSTAITGTSASDRRIIVPDELYNTWITTSGWTNQTSYIRKASEWTD